MKSIHGRNRTAGTNRGPWRSARFIASLLAAGLAAAGASVLAQQSPPTAGTKPQSPEQKQERNLAKLAEPWPDAATIEKHRVDAERRALFQSTEPLPLTIRADFRAVNRDRDPQSTKRFPATLTVAGSGGKDVSIPVQLGSRGNLRLRPEVCGFVQLRIDFPKSSLQDTPLAGQSSLKLATHCQNDAAYDQYVLREYTIYRLFNLFSPRSFRARLVRASYVDAASGKPVASRYGFLIEDESDVARRMGGRLAQVTGQLFPGLDSDTLLTMMVLQWMIGNTDMSIVQRHNMVLVQVPSGIRYPVTYDFDSAGLVDTPYAAPDKRLGLTSTRQRLFRGPCRPMEQYEPILARFREKKADVMALFDSVPELSDRSRRDGRAYLEEFYAIIGSPDRVKRVFLAECVKGPTI
jgi:hypothetical protein